MDTKASTETCSSARPPSETATVTGQVRSYAVAKSAVIRSKVDTATRVEPGRTVPSSKISGDVVVRISTLSVRRASGTPTDR